jgi:GMP synthase (glutamine-hydrolysing)
MRKFLIVVPELVAPPGLVGEAIIASGAGYDAILPVARHATASPFNYPGLPGSPGAYAGLIVMGGPMSANDTAEHPFVLELMDLIRAFDGLGRPVLGVCLGAQIIAKAYGGEVYRMGPLESGFYQLELTPAGREDPVMAALGAPLTVFQNHYEAVRAIPQAVTLATGGACDVQAFRVGRAVYGVQFHPEVTIDIVRDWIRVFGGTFCRDEPRLLTDLDRQFREHFPRYRAICDALVGRWMAQA